MAYEISPVSVPTPATEFPVPTVRVLNFTGTGFTCSRGAGEQSNVITIEINHAAAGCLFLDQFLGAAGAITGHTPDTAPTGTVYANAGIGPNTTLALTGAGAITGVQVGYGTAGVADVSASAPPFAVSATIPYTFTAVLRPSDSLADSDVQVRFLNTADNGLIQIGINRDGSGNYLATVDAENFNVLTGDGYAYWQKASSAGEHTISVYVTGTTMEVTYDGGAPEPPYSAGTEPLPSAFTELRYVVDINTPSDNSSISLVSLCNGAAG